MARRQARLADYDKLIPPPDILATELSARVEDKVRNAVVERILREANVDAQVAAALADIETPDNAKLATGIRQLFKATPDEQWRRPHRDRGHRIDRGGRRDPARLSFICPSSNSKG